MPAIPLQRPTCSPHRQRFYSELQDIEDGFENWSASIGSIEFIRALLNAARKYARRQTDDRWMIEARCLIEEFQIRLTLIELTETNR